MSMDDRDDPGADTAMFRAYVDESNDPGAAGPRVHRTALIALVAIVALLALVLVLILAG
jgi:hypothetical protein